MSKKWVASLTLSIFIVTALSEARAKADLRGVASWYSQSDSGVGRETASGEVFDDSGKTCASWNFTFGTFLQITNTENGRSVICRVNDRGPAKRLNRLIDLSPSAFREIADLKQGLIPVVITPL